MSRKGRENGAPQFIPPGGPKTWEVRPGEARGDEEPHLFCSLCSRSGTTLAFPGLFLKHNTNYCEITPVK